MVFPVYSNGQYKVYHCLFQEPNPTCDCKANELKVEPAKFCPRRTRLLRPLSSCLRLVLRYQMRTEKYYNEERVKTKPDKIKDLN